MPKAEAVFEPSISEVPDPDRAHASGVDWRAGGSTDNGRHDRIIRVAFYDVRHCNAPVLVLDSVGIIASKLEVSRPALFLRVVLRNAVSPDNRADLRDGRPGAGPMAFAEMDFQGPVFAAVMLRADQDIVPDDPTKTTANFARLVVADKDFQSLRSPARYQPRGASGSSEPALPDVDASPPRGGEEFEKVPVPGVDPSVPAPKEMAPPGLVDAEPGSVPGVGGRFGVAFALGLRSVARGAFRRIAFDGPVQPRGERPTTRVADLVGHSHDGEAPQWFAAGPFVGDAAIPFARALGIDNDLEPAGLLFKSRTPAGERFSLDNPHWTRRMRVGFERGPCLPGHPAIRTIEVTFTRAFGVRRDIFLSNTDAATLRAQFPVSLYLKSRPLRPLPPEPHQDCQPDERQYRFVQRQPPLWCCEAVPVAQPVKFLVAIEEVSASDAVRMWNRDLAGRFLGAVGSVRSDRRLSLFPSFILPEDQSAVEKLDENRFSLIFSLQDSVRMFGEPPRFDDDGLSAQLWRLDCGTLRDVYDRAIAELYVNKNPSGARASAKYDHLMLRLLEKLPVLGGGDEVRPDYLSPERVHFRAASAAAPCRSEDMPRPELRDALSGTTLGDGELIQAPRERFDPDGLSWSAVAAFEGPNGRRIRMIFETPLFVGSDGMAFRWQGLFSFRPNAPSSGETAPANGEGSAWTRFDGYLCLSDLRVMAGLVDGSTPTGPREGDGPRRPPFASFFIEEVQLRSGRNATSVARLGAYDVEFDWQPHPNAAGAEPGSLVAWLAPLDYEDSPRQKFQDPTRREFQLHTKLAYTLPVRRTTPGAQDDVEGADRRRTTLPLVIALRDGAAAESAANLSLAVTEDAHHLELQRIRLALRGDVLPAASLVVIDSAPTFIGRISMAEVRGADDNLIAEWDSDSGGSATWRVVKQADGYELVLPSPAVGETVARDHKYGMQVRQKADGRYYEDLADFRLAPPVTLRLGTDARFADRRTAEPPFNTRRIFGTAEDHAPFGAPLLQANFELLYGLTAIVQGTFGLVLREVGTDIGRAPLAFASSTGVGRNSSFVDSRTLPGAGKVHTKQEVWTKRLMTGWSRVLDSVESRPAVLSMRKIGDERTSTLSTGVEFALRPAADIQVPTELNGEFGNTPYAPGKPRNADARAAVWNTHPPLAGGADAGFESANVYRELWSKPTSVSGELTDITLTAFGASGAQRATFSNGKQRIISRASQGRTHFYSLERIGRIATYWNRCKHVVVYERTTSATAQFDQSQPALRGRPVLRKVREYIEILEPMRSFPESGTQRQRCGPVLGLRFDATIIPVDSAWGSDVGAFGWKLPLYLPGADGYIPPPIDFEMAIDSRGGTASRLCRCLTPERIFFYTSTRDGDGEDTNAWGKVPGVDYCIEPPPRAPAVISHRPGSIDARLPDAEEIPLGFELFTQFIDSGDGPPINLRAGRPGQAMVARLRNITVTRGALPELAQEIEFEPVGSPAISVKAGEALNETRRLRGIARDGIAALAGTLEEMSEVADATPQGIEDFLRKRKGAIVERLQASEIGQAFETVGKILTPALDRPGSALCRSLGSETRRVAEKLCVEAGKLEGGLRAEIDGAIAIAEGPFARLEALAASATPAVDAVNAQLAELKGVIESLRAQIAAAFPSSRTPLHDVLKSIPSFTAPDLGVPLERAADWLKESADGAADIDAVEGQTREGVAGARRLVIGARRTLEGLSRSVPLTPLAGNDGALARTTVALASAERIIADVDRLIVDAFKRLRQKKETFSEASDEVVKELRDAAETLNGEVKITLGVLEAVLKALRRPFAPGQATTDNEVYAGVPTGLTERVRTVRRELLGVSNTIEAARADSITSLDGMKDTLDGFGGADVPQKFEALRQSVAGIRAQVFTRVEDGSYRASGLILVAIQNQFGKFLGLQPTGAELCRNLGNATDAFGSFCGKAIGDTLDGYAQVATDLLRNLASATDFEAAFEGLAKTLKKNIESIVGGETIVEVKDALRGALAAAAGEVDAAAERALAPLRNALLGPGAEGDLQDAADDAVRLYRSFGDAFKVPSLDCNRDLLGYFFDENQFQIDTTPAAALFDRAGEGLKGLGLRVPISGLTERLIPKFGKDFKISDLFPDIGGIKLDKLLKQALVPDGAQDYIDVTHGIDKESRAGWIDATVRPITVGGSEPMFELLGLAVLLQEGKFSGSARQQVGLDGQQVSRGQGKIEGDWKLRFGGYDLVTFQRTPLSFDQTGKFDFAVSPDRVALAPELSFLDKFLNDNPLLGGAEQGFTVGILQEGLLPVGVECLLDLPIPPMIYGTTGVTGMRLIAGMQLRVVPDFAMVVHAAIGSIEAPFTITIFILGGTGWIQTWGQYTPRTGELRASVSVAVGASAMLGFSFGPISGSVLVVVAIKGQLITSNQASDVLSVSLLIICTGQVDVAGLISASLLLVMELRFEDEGRQIYGTGTVSFRIRISRFFTYRISQSCTYRFKGSGGQTPRKSQEHVNAVA